MKVFLHISKEEQRERLQARLDNPVKRWKFKASDLEARARWDDWEKAFEEAIADAGIEKNQIEAAWLATAIEEQHVGGVGPTERMCQSRSYCRPFTPLGVMPQHRCANPFGRRTRIVTASVVDHDHFANVRRHAADHLRDGARFVQRGDDCNRFDLHSLGFR